MGTANDKHERRKPPPRISKVIKAALFSEARDIEQEIEGRIAAAEAATENAANLIKRQNLCITEILRHIANKRAELLTEYDMPPGFPVYVDAQEIKGIIETTMGLMTEEHINNNYPQE